MGPYHRNQLTGMFHIGQAAAREIVDLFAANPGAGAIGHKGAMLDRPHLARAQALLKLAARQ